MKTIVQETSRKPADSRVNRDRFAPAAVQRLLVRSIRAVPKLAVRRIGERAFFIDLDCGDFHELGPCHEMYEFRGAVIAVLRTAIRLRYADGTDVRLDPGIWSVSQPRELQLSR